MADKKISQLTAATTPLAGTETLPIVQSGATVKVTVDNLTAGKTVEFTNAVLPYDASSEVVFKFNDSYKFGVSNRNGDARTLRLFAKAADNDGDVVIAAGNDVEHVRVKGTGDVQMKTGDLVVGTAGKGIDFSANAHAAGMTSELLNDYEEGTWTPNFNTLTIGDGTLFGRYTKVGRVITCEFGFIFGSTSSFSGTVGSCGGFPYASRSFGADTYSIINGVAFDVGSNWYELAAFMSRGADFCIGPAIGTAAPFTWAPGDTLVMTAIYEVA